MQCVCVCVRVCVCVCIRQYLVIVGRAEQDIVSRGVPLDEPHSSGVTLELFLWYGDVPQYAVLRNVPNFHLGHNPVSLKITSYMSLYSEKYAIFIIWSNYIDKCFQSYCSLLSEARAASSYTQYTL